jgi:hypothetical protein
MLKQLILENWKSFRYAELPAQEPALLFTPTRRSDRRR